MDGKETQREDFETSSDTLFVLRQRVRASLKYFSQEVIHTDYDTFGEGYPVEFIDIFVGPHESVYNPQVQQKNIEELAFGIKKSFATQAGESPLGLTNARIQFIKDLENKKQVITLIMLPQARYARLCGDYLQKWFDKVFPYIPDLSQLTMHLENNVLLRFRDKEQELEAWVNSLFRQKLK